MRNDTSRQPFKVWLIAVLLSLITFSIDTVVRLTFVRNGISQVYGLFIPLQVTLTQIVTVPKDIVEKSQQSSVRVQALEQKNAELRTQIAEAQFLKKENEALRNEIEKSSSSSAQEASKVVVARVIHSLTESGVNVGTQDGIDTGDLVFSQERLIGRVGKVSTTFAEVAFIHRKAFEVVAENQAGVKGVIRVQGSRVLLDQIAVDKEIQVGDYVYSSGSVSQAIPPGLVIGEITGIESDPSSPVKMAVIDTGIALDTIQVVVIKKFTR